MRLGPCMPSNAEEATKRDVEQRQLPNTVQCACHTERLESCTRLDPRTSMQAEATAADTIIDLWKLTVPVVR